MKTIASILLLWLLSGCANNALKGAEEPESDPLSGFHNRGPVDEIRNYQIRSWHALGDQQLIIEAGRNRNYLVTLARRCHGLSSATTIGLTDTSGRVTKYDSVIFESFSGGVERCRISTIEKLEQAAPSIHQPL